MRSASAHPTMTARASAVRACWNELGKMRPPAPTGPTWWSVHCGGLAGKRLGKRDGVVHAGQLVDLHPGARPDRDPPLELALRVVRQETEGEIDQALEPFVRDPRQRILRPGLGPLP